MEADSLRIWTALSAVSAIPHVETPLQLPRGLMPRARQEPPTPSSPVGPSGAAGAGGQAGAEGDNAAAATPSAVMPDRQPAGQPAVPVVPPADEADRRSAVLAFLSAKAASVRQTFGKPRAQRAAVGTGKPRAPQPLPQARTPQRTPLAKRKRLSVCPTPRADTGDGATAIASKGTPGGGPIPSKRPRGSAEAVVEGGLSAPTVLAVAAAAAAIGPGGSPASAVLIAKGFGGGVGAAPGTGRRLSLPRPAQSLRVQSPQVPRVPRPAGLQSVINGRAQPDVAVARRMRDHVLAAARFVLPASAGGEGPGAGGARQVRRFSPLLPSQQNRRLGRLAAAMCFFPKVSAPPSRFDHLFKGYRSLWALRLQDGAAGESSAAADGFRKGLLWDEPSRKPFAVQVRVWDPGNGAFSIGHMAALPLFERKAAAHVATEMEMRVRVPRRSVRSRTMEAGALLRRRFPNSASISATRSERASNPR